MTPTEVKAAADAVRNWEKAEERLSKLAPLEVTGITLSNNIHLPRDAGGTGWLSHMGYPDSLKRAMTQALFKWAHEEATKWLEEARQRGVKSE